MRRIVLALGLCALLGCDDGKQTLSGGKKPDEASTSPPPATTPKNKKGEPNKKVDPPKVEPEPPKPKTFEDAWDEAVEEGKRLDAAEPQLTEARMKLLTGFEAGEARLHMAGGLNFKSVPALTSLGLTPWLHRQSRAAAIPDAAFRELARTVWAKLPNQPGVVLRMMNEWKLVNEFWRAGAVNAIKANSPAADLLPEVRDAVLQLVGPEWFTAK